MQSVEGTLAASGGGVYAILGTHGNVGGRSGVARAGSLGDHLVSFHLEEVRARIQDFADQQLESAFGGFELIAFDTPSA